MTEDEFEDFLDDCYSALEEKQDQLWLDYNIDQFDEYWYDQLTESIQFKNNDVVELEFSMIPIGSWSSKTNTWMWSWANESTTEPMRKKSAKLKELTKLTGHEMFEIECFETEEIEAYELTSMALHHLGAMGMYMMPSGHLKIFIALMSKK